MSINTAADEALNSLARSIKDNASDTINKLKEDEELEEAEEQSILDKVKFTIGDETVSLQNMVDLGKKLKEIADINKDKKFNLKDVIIWLKIGFLSFMMGLTLTLVFRYDSIILAWQERRLTDPSFILMIVVSAITFTWRSAVQVNKKEKDDAYSENKTLKNKIKSLITSKKNMKESHESELNVLKEMIRDIHNTYQNCLYEYETGLAEKDHIIRSKEKIAIYLFEKWEALKEICKVQARFGVLEIIEKIESDK